MKRSCGSTRTLDRDQEIIVFHQPSDASGPNAVSLTYEELGDTSIPVSRIRTRKFLYFRAQDRLGRIRFGLIIETAYEGSIRDLQQAIKIYPALLDAIRCLWGARKKLNQYNEAVDDFDKVLEIIPDYIDVLFMRGEAKMELNQKSNAKLDFQKALEFAIEHNNTEFREKCLEKLNATT